MMEVFSELPRDLNFLDHTSDIGWKACVLYLASIGGPCSASFYKLLKFIVAFMAGSRGRCR